MTFSASSGYGKTMKSADNIDWSLTTWEGSRREQLRRWRQMTLRQRLEALEGMAEVAAALKTMRKRNHQPG